MTVVFRIFHTSSVSISLFFSTLTKSVPHNYHKFHLFSLNYFEACRRFIPSPSLSTCSFVFSAINTTTSSFIINLKKSSTLQISGHLSQTRTNCNDVTKCNSDIAEKMPCEVVAMSNWYHLKQ